MVRDILLVQKRELTQRLQELYVPREVTVPSEESDLIRVVIGPRRAGKSFFAMHWLKSVGRFGYVNFDDERLVNLEDYDHIFAAVEAVYSSPRWLLLDEVQNLPRWELLLNRLQRQGHRLIVTGSSAHLLSTELATHLTGRHIPVVVFPFSFCEYATPRGGELTSAEYAALARDYAMDGGYPEPLLKKLSRKDYLTTLLQSILFRDIVKRFRIRSPQGIEDLAYYLLSNVGSEYSFHRLTGVTRCRSVHTVEKYLHHLEQAFLFFSLRRFSFKVREQVRANRKIYCVDNGLISALAFRFSPNVGRLYENLVAIELRKREMNGDAKVFFWKNVDQEEVDFVIQRGIHVEQLVQVCAELQETRTKTREIRALLKASRELKCEQLLMLTESLEDEQEFEWYGIRGRIRFIPLWKWLLDPHVV